MWCVCVLCVGVCGGCFVSMFVVCVGGVFMSCLCCECFCGLYVVCASCVCGVFCVCGVCVVLVWCGMCVLCV